MALRYDEWDVYTIPGQRRVVRIPPVDSDEWDREVEVVAQAVGEIESGGPMTLDVFESLCVRGEVWFVLHQGDNGTWADVCGRFRDRDKGLAAVVAASYSFVLDPYGRPLSLLEGDDETWLEDLSWSPADGDAEDLDGEDEPLDAEDRALLAQLADPTRRRGCRGCPSPSAYARYARVERHLRRRLQREARAWTERLWATTIVDEESGVTLVGPDAATVLPADGTWHAIPVGPEEQQRLLDRLGGRRVTIEDGQFIETGVLVQRLGDRTAARVGRAFVTDVVWSLTRDTVCAIRCHDPAIVATAVRVI